MESKQTTTWYMVRWGEITEVQVVKELPKSLVIKSDWGKGGERTVRSNSYEKYFKRFDEAKAALIRQLEVEIIQSEAKISKARIALNKIQKMEK